MSCLPAERLQHGVEEIFRDVLRRSDFALRAEMRTGDLEGWDSFANVEILMACEARWNIRFSSAEIDRIGSVGDLISELSAKVG